MSRKRKAQEDLIIYPTQGESFYEAYHSVFSSLTGEYKIYRTLAIICGAKDFVLYNPDDYINGEYLTKDRRGNIDPSKINVIISKKTPNNETHYQYVDFNGNIQDPYEMFQLYNSHGNCFLYALYLAFRSNNPTVNKNLNNIRNLLEIKNDDGIHPYYKVKPEYAQLAYQLFVDNDYKIIDWALSIIDKKFDYEIGPTSATLRKLYNDYWSAKSDFWNNTIATIIDKNNKTKEITYRQHYNVPIKMTFDVFLTYLTAFAHDKENTYQMTWEQVENWDVQAKSGTLPYDNSGIEDAKQIIKPDKYDIDSNLYNDFIKNVNPIQLLGGNKKLTRKFNKTKYRNKSNKKRNKTNIKRNKSKSRTINKIKK